MAIKLHQPGTGAFGHTSLTVWRSDEANKLWVKEGRNSAITLTIKKYPRGGPQGEQGDAGDAGAQGDAGAAGPQGAQGDVGAASTVRGPQGARGGAGPQGEQGDAGADSTVAGPRGAQGDAGAKGAQGEQGPGGDDSTVPGPQGAQGDAGAAGARGEQGPGGAAGARGPQGAQGDAGDDGAQGDAGDDGADSTVPGPQGARGVQGDAGAAGQTGVGRVPTTLGEDTQNQSTSASSWRSIAITAPARNTDMIVRIVTARGERSMRFPSNRWLDAGTAAASDTPDGKYTFRFKTDRNKIDFAHTTFYIVRVSDTSLALWSAHWPSFNDYKLTVEQVEYQGYAGPAGDAGAQGEQGDVGAASTVAGPQGEQGIQGAQGDAGADSVVAGPQGEQGPAGGPQGEQGEQGPAGPQGATTITSSGSGAASCTVRATYATEANTPDITLPQTGFGLIQFTADAELYFIDFAQLAAKADATYADTAVAANRYTVHEQSLGFFKVYLGHTAAEKLLVAVDHSAEVNMSIKIYAL